MIILNLCLFLPHCNQRILTCVAVNATILGTDDFVLIQGYMQVVKRPRQHKIRFDKELSPPPDQDFSSLACSVDSESNFINIKNKSLVVGEFNSFGKIMFFVVTLHHPSYCGTTFLKSQTLHPSTITFVVRGFLKWEIL